MKTFLIKKEHLDSDNYYIGKEDLSNYNGNIECSENLGYVKFKKSLIAKGYIFFKAGSGIEAGDGIEAGELLETGINNKKKIIIDGKEIEISEDSFNELKKQLIDEKQ